MDDSPLIEFEADAIDACAAVLGLKASPRVVLMRQDLADVPEFVALQNRRHRLRKPELYQRQLDQLAKLCDRLPARPQPDQAERLQRRIDELEDPSRNLLRWHVAELEDPEDATKVLQGPDSEQLLERAVHQDVQGLGRAARAASDDIGALVVPGRGGARHRADHCRDETLDLLALRFWEYTGQKPRISTDPISKQPSGRFLGFVQICFRQVGWNDTADSIRHRFRKLCKQQRDQYRQDHPVEKYFLN